MPFTMKSCCSVRPRIPRLLYPLLGLYAVSVALFVFYTTDVQISDFWYDPYYSTLVFVDDGDTGEQYRRFMNVYDAAVWCPDPPYHSQGFYPQEVRPIPNRELNNSNTVRRALVNLSNITVLQELQDENEKLARKMLEDPTLEFEIQQKISSIMRRIEDVKSTLDDENPQQPERDDATSPTELKLSNNIIHSIGIVLAITTKQADNVTLDESNMVRRMPFFVSLIPSFCRTASRYYDYHFFLAYDQDDPNLTRKQFTADMTRVTMDMIEKGCPPDSRYTIHYVHCLYSQRVTWAQNDAAMAAYTHGMEYIYRINDDMQMMSRGWSETFISVLRHLNPPNVGICGPRHDRGNLKVLTFEFVHRTHIDIMGCYYPRSLKNWDGDVWITSVYRPQRSFKVKHIRVIHTQESGTRYHVTMSDSEKFDQFLIHSKNMVNRYIKALRYDVKSNPRKVIALSINTTSSSHLWGAVRNAQLRLVHLPDWTMRVYLKCNVEGASSNDSRPGSDVTVSGRVIGTLASLGVQIRVVAKEIVDRLPVEMWRYLVADDPDVDNFILCDPEHRLNERDTQIVSNLAQNMAEEGSTKYNRHDPAVIKITTNKHESGASSHIKIRSDNETDYSKATKSSPTKLPQMDLNSSTYQDVPDLTMEHRKHGVLWVKDSNNVTKLYGANTKALRGLLKTDIKSLLLNYERTKRNPGDPHQQFNIYFRIREILTKTQQDFRIVHYDGNIDSTRYDQHEVPMTKT